MAESPGQRLSQARTALGWSIEDVSKATRIRPIQLTGLEKDDYSAFASMAYARNFLQLYARHLKVDVSDALARMIVPDRVDVSQYQYLQNQDDEDPAYRPAGKVQRPAEQPSRPPSARWLLIVAIAVPAIFFGSLLFLNLRRIGLGAAGASPKAVVTPTPTPPPATPTPAPVVIPQITPPPAQLWESASDPVISPTLNPTPEE